MITYKLFLSQIDYLYDCPFIKLNTGTELFNGKKPLTYIQEAAKSFRKQGYKFVAVIKEKNNEFEEIISLTSF